METYELRQVLVVEDSYTTRRFLVELINSMPALMVCGEAPDGVEAVRLVQELRPDVISMDIQMPRMDGLEAIRQIMATAPVPVVVASSGVGQQEVDYAMLAMEAGAVAAIEKPSSAPEDEQKRRDFVRLLELMSDVSVVRRTPGTPLTDIPHPKKIKPNSRKLPKLIVMGASAGGPGALAHVLSELPADFSVPILVVQHLVEEFVPGFADWLSRRCELSVKLAPEGDKPVAGEVWVAPGGVHLALNQNGKVVLNSEKGQQRHQPSIDVLFESAARLHGGRAVGVLLTGMGEDGAQGLAMLHEKGARTIAQDEESCVVFGMPASAIARGAAEFVLPVEQMPAALMELVGYKQVG
ncbi:MAG: chemotaxis-specific protein-glutamate methyltransferase CheB [Chloroflexi bacterium]|nr:chemotaxis-specific protein-glutamate methyltransferase CheB [Chloroflexota bacterium]